MGQGPKIGLSLLGSNGGGKTNIGCVLTVVGDETEERNRDEVI